ncbi:MAG: hypothetical protein ABI565_11990 [Vicinamibacteria bacterium]
MISLALLAVITFDAGSIAQTSATLNALGPHPFGSPRNQAAAQFVAAKLQEVGLAQTTVEEFTFEGSTGTNVVANLPGRSDRLLIIATHHDSKKDAQDVSGRSRSLALLIEIGRQASRLRPAKTWILASFDGGESKGEGFAHYLETLGKSRDLIDGVVLLDASPLRDTATEPSLIAPACVSGLAPNRRALASRDLVASALGGIPSSTDASFDDPGISLLTQPFIRAFKTDCDPLAARALFAGLGVLQVADASFSKSVLSRGVTAPPRDPALHDDAGVRLAELAFAALQGIDGSSEARPRSDSWLVVGRSTWPGWLVFLIGLLTLAPGFLALRAGGTRLALRVAHGAIFTLALYYEPEIALFSLGLANLLPPSAAKRYLTLALLPFALLLAAGALCFLRGEVTGTWLSIWIWAGLLGSAALLYLTPRGGKKAPARARKGKR